MAEKLDTSGVGKASDFEISNAANDIFNILRVFDSPKDAAAILALAHGKLIQAAFPPEFKDQAVLAIDAHSDYIKSVVSEGYN